MAGMPQQEDLQLLKVGQLIFGHDLQSICQSLLPAYKAVDLAWLHSRYFCGSAEDQYILELRESGLQPGALVSGNARIKLLRYYTGTVNKTIQAAFRAYDSCSLPLLSLVEVLVQAAGAATFSTAFLQALPYPWVDKDKLTHQTCSQEGLSDADHEQHVAALLEASGRPDAPHRVCADPSGKQAGMPTSRRRLMCANCGVTSTRVWRVANAGLMCCNACGMFYQKHHQHRPEHLLALNKAKQDARQATAATALLPQDSQTEPGDSYGAVNSDGTTGEWQYGAAGMPGSHQESYIQPRASKRQRTRRKPQANKWLVSDEFVTWEGGHSSDGYDSEHDSGADNELEDLLQDLLNRPQSPSATVEMAAATLAALRYSSSETPPAAAEYPAATPAAFNGDPNMPWGHFSQPQQQPQQHQQPVLDAQQHALAAAMLRSVLEPASAQPAPTAHTQQQGAVPTSQPTTPQGLSMAEVWAQVARHVQAGPGVAGPAAAAAAGSPGDSTPANRQQGYGASFAASPSALQAMGQEFGQPMQQEEQEGEMQGRCYLPAGYPGSSSYSSPGSQAAAGTGAGAFNRQDSTNSSGGSFSLPRSSSDAGSAEGRAAGGIARSMSRFAAEHKQVAYRQPAGPASPGGMRPRSRSNGKRRDGQPACCANCACESTCLWRRDKYDTARILCNACGIYKATNGVDRPLSGRFPARRHGKPMLVKRTATPPALAGPPGASATHPVSLWASAQQAAPYNQAPAAPLAANTAAPPLSRLTGPMYKQGAAFTGDMAAAAAGTRAAAAGSIGAELALPGVTVTALRHPDDEGQPQEQEAEQGWGWQEAQQEHLQHLAAQHHHHHHHHHHQQQHAKAQQPQQQSQQHRQEAVAAAVQQGPQQAPAREVVSSADAELVKQLLSVWAHAKALQRPVVCASTGYRVHPDGRYTRLAEPELKGLVNPLLLRNSSTNSARSSQDMPPSMLRVSSSGASMSNGFGPASAAGMGAAGMGLVNTAAANAAGAAGAAQAPRLFI